MSAIAAQRQRFRSCRWPLLLLALTAALPGQAQHYIRDTVYVPLRSGPSNQHRILDNLSSGTAVEPRGSAQEGWVQVRTAEGRDGWLEEQYLTDQPIARERLTAAEETAARLRRENRDLQAKLAAAAAEQQAAASQVAALETSEAQLNGELERVRTLSADSIRLSRENEELSAQTQQLAEQARELAAENERLNQRLERDQFMNGAYAVALGVGLTLVVPRLWPRKRRSEWG